MFEYEIFLDAKLPLAASNASIEKRFTESDRQTLVMHYTVVMSYERQVILVTNNSVVLFDSQLNHPQSA